MVMWGGHGHPISTPDICRWCNPGRTGCPLWHKADIAWCTAHVRIVAVAAFASSAAGVLALFGRPSPTCRDVNFFSPDTLLP